MGRKQMRKQDPLFLDTPHTHLSGGEAFLHKLMLIARTLNMRGDCSVVRTHRVKIHLLSLAQIRMASRSHYQPLLANALKGFGDLEPCLWALVYTNEDPGFFCFN